MGTAKVAIFCFNGSQPVVSLSRRSRRNFSCDRGFICRRLHQQSDHSHSFGSCTSKSLFCQISKSKVRACRIHWLANVFPSGDNDEAGFIDEEVHNKGQDFSKSGQFGKLERVIEFELPDENIPPNVTSNSTDLPISLRMLKRKRQLQKASESACCSVKKAFSSMVFIIREVQSYTLQMREILFYEDLQGILASVQKDLNASFVWLFQQIFSGTPTLMVYLMIMLANFTVYSMGHTAAVSAASASLPPGRESVSVQENDRRLIGGTAGEMDGSDETFVSSNQERSISSEEMETEVFDTRRMQGESPDYKTRKLFVSPVSVEVEPDGTDYLLTDLHYRRAVAEEPDNPLLLSNYAQFLFLFVHDHDRAEEYFQRAARVDPPDAESLSRYARFMWLARNDLDGAEELYLRAKDAEPDNHHYRGLYASFLFATGATDTCYPLD